MKVYDPSALGLHVVKINGLEAKLKCPFHLDNTPSAMFNLENGLFHCFGCGHSANAYQLAVEFDGEISKIDYALIPHREAEEREWRQLSYCRSAKGSKYLRSRLVTDEQIKRFGILWHKEGVMFPIYDKQKLLVGIQERRFSLEPKYMLHGDRTAVWPLSNLKHENLILVEGVFGVVRADLFGQPAVCTMGASAIPHAAKILKGHNIIIAFDDDLAGYLGAYSFMKLHNTSAAILPGLEVDETTKEEFEKRIFSVRPERDILGFAIRNGNKTLVSAIRAKEKNEKAKSRKYTFTRTRKVGHG